MKTYVDPKVRLIDSSIPDIGYFIWLKSRQWIIQDMEGATFMVEMFPNPLEGDSFMNRIPDQFYVGDELVNKFEYKERIDRMNLQYNNVEQFVFEIDGSCLFRDMLFNINKIAQWAQSNRFLFSILDEVERFNECHYHISSEYKDIPEWEAQFDTYMDLIKHDPIVDHNRLEMPYSISSTFWIAINKKTLLDFVGFLKYSAPFFYDIYGVQMLSEVGYDPSNIKLSQKPSAAITQYLMKDKDSWVEGSWDIQGTQIVNSYMGLILYSQFIRQADTRIVGLYDLMMHTDIDEFKHKVFKGNTIFPIHYVADRDKVLSTVKTRLCAFAMSSGSDPCSWSYFLNNFLPEKLDPETLMKWLPCSFKNGRLQNCKFHDDIKFRNEGKEISNCPCPLVSLSLKDAQTKLDRDNNRIGNAYFELTNYILKGKVPFYHSQSLWTSELLITSDTPVTSDELYLIDTQVSYIEDRFSSFHERRDQMDPEGILPEKFRQFGLNGDLTCMLKGLLIDEIHQILRRNHKSYLINFGGDIFGCNVNKVIGIRGTNFNIQPSTKYFSIFTSGNDEVRGLHIVGNEVQNSRSTVLMEWIEESHVCNTLVDILATKINAKEFDRSRELFEMLPADYSTRCHVFDFVDDKLLQQTYTASPFFNPEQVAIRDKMVSKFANQYRPDLTPSAKLYDNDHNNNHLVEQVVEDNLIGIDTSLYLVFPNHTSDLGTLFEVGRAIAIGRPIIKYDELKDQYIITTHYDVKLPEDKNYLFDCSKKRDAIAIGYVSNFVPNSSIFYSLSGCPDNIMMSVHYTHVELEDGQYVKYERNIDERDQ